MSKILTESSRVIIAIDISITQSNLLELFLYYPFATNTAMELNINTPGEKMIPYNRIDSWQK